MTINNECEFVQVRTMLVYQLHFSVHNFKENYYFHLYQIQKNAAEISTSLKDQLGMPKIMDRQ